MLGKSFLNLAKCLSVFEFWTACSIKQNYLMVIDFYFVVKTLLHMFMIWSLLAYDTGVPTRLNKLD